MLSITFNGAAGQVTGSQFLLKSSGTGATGKPVKILIDCGLQQGNSFCERQNWDAFPFEPREIEAVFITHTHIDHIGLLPKLYKDGFRGTIYSTAPTRDAAELLLLDSDHILATDALQLKLPPLYTTEDVMAVMRHWRSVEYHVPVVVGNGPARVTVTFGNAGHVLGSSFIVIESRGEKIVFSGDIGNSPAPIIGSREDVPTDATYAVMEATYGDRLHEDIARRHELLEDAVEDVAKSRGVLLIPAFAMERTQDLLYEIHELSRAGRIPPIPIFVDSPLAIKLIEVYRKYPKFFEPGLQGGKESKEMFNFPGLTLTPTTEESKAINNVPAPKISIAGSGMSQGGRILHHERRYLSDPKNMLLIIGFQAHGSLGRALLEGARSVRIMGEEIPVRARVRAIGGYSAHADQAQLLAWAAPMRQSLKKIFLVHAEPGPANALREKLEDEFAIHTTIPKEGEEVML